MKRSALRILSIIIAAIMIYALAACGGNSDIRMATGGVSGTYYEYGSVLAQIISEKLSGTKIAVISTGASLANIQLIENGEITMAIVQNDVMDYAAKGEFLFDKEYTKFSAVAGLYAEACQIVASPGIETIADLSGKTVSIGDAGSGVSFNAIHILQAYDLTLADITVENLGFAESADALKAGGIDAFFCVAGAPTTAVAELAADCPIRILEIDGEHMDSLIARYPFYTRFDIPGGVYKGVDDKVQTVAVKASLIVSSSLSEDFVYNLTKALFVNKEEIAEAHSKGELLEISYAVAGISVPFHPGAKRYYDEVGAFD